MILLKGREYIVIAVTLLLLLEVLLNLLISIDATLIFFLLVLLSGRSTVIMNSAEGPFFFVSCNSFLTLFCMLVMKYGFVTKVEFGNSCT